MANIVIDLQSLYIDAEEAVLNAYLKGNPEATNEIHEKVKEVLRKRMDEEPWALIENFEIDEYGD